MCLFERKRQPQRHSLFNFISFLPRSSNQNMYDTASLCCILYKRLAVQKTIYLLLFSVFVLQQTSGNPQKLKSLKPATQTLLNVFCCVLASRFLHSPDWRRIMQLCYQRHTIWLLFISCFPVRSSLHAFLFLLSKIRQNCTVHSKDRWCTYVGLKVAWKN